MVLDRLDRARLTGALHPAFAIRFVSRLAELRAALEDAPVAPCAILTEAVDGDGVPVTTAVAQWRTLAPRVAVLGYCRRPEESARDAVDLARAGVDELVFRGVDDFGVALRGTLASAEQACAATRALDVLREVVDPAVLPFIAHCLHYGKRSLRVGEVARALGVHRKTLVNHCARAEMPPPEIVIGWCRLCLVGAMLETTGCTIERVAGLLDYPSSTALRNTVRRYLNATATELRRRGGLSYVLEHFLLRAKVERVRRHAALLDAANEVAG